MNKVIIIGCPGSGKSTFSKALHEKTGLPLYHLDMLYWNSDRTTVSKELFRERLQKVIEENQWIIDGNYSSTIELRLKECDTVFFLDYSTDVCIEGIRERKGKERYDLPWLETKLDPEFKQFIEDFPKDTLPYIYELIEKYKSEKQVIIFKSREEADGFIAYLQP